MLPCYLKCVDIVEEISLVMAKGRPGGNPDIVKFSFKQKYDWGESCTERIAVRLPPTLAKKLKNIENWQEFTRQAIAKAIEETKSD